VNVSPLSVLANSTPATVSNAYRTEETAGSATGVAPMGKEETSDQVAPLLSERWAGCFEPSPCTNDQTSTPPSAVVAIGPAASLAMEGWEAKGAQVCPPSLE